MKIKDKLNFTKEELEEYGAITIAVFGDSVTHGAVGPGELDYESVYWNRLKKKLNEYRSYVPVNVINAGIGGTSASSSLGRLDSQVLRFDPDLIIVCFGLNDVGGPIENFKRSLGIIFEKCKKSGAELIFMTPNMLNTTFGENESEDSYARLTASWQNGGRMDEFMDAARAVAEEAEVAVCDCYAEWKKLSLSKDVTQLLANRINHPVREMHELFAQMLFDEIMKDVGTAKANDSTMAKST